MGGIDSSAIERLHYADDQLTPSGAAVVLGPAERPLSGRFHRARGARLGSVVLCPPWGDEYVGAYQAWRSLAGELAAAGFDVLRFDLDGAGNSYGSDVDPDRTDAWLGSVVSALDFLAVRGDAAPAVIGLRFGATLAALVASRRRIGPLVLWDPILEGRRIVRVMRANALVRGSEPAEDPAALAVSGFDVTAATLRDLAAVRFDDEQYLPMTPAVLVITEDQVARVRRLTDGMEQRGVAVTFCERAGAIQLVTEPAETSEVPDDIIETIVTWLSTGSSPDAPSAPELDPAVMLDPEGNWTEHHLSIGVQRIAAVLTVATRPTSSGAILFPTIGKTRNIGPGRLWVTWSRELAAHGFSSLRFDVSGLGDSEGIPGQPRGLTYPPEAIDDVIAVAGELEGIGITRVIVVGVCSGATLAIDAAMHVDAIRGAISINGWHHHVADDPSDPRRRRRARPARPALVQTAANHRIGAGLLRRLPRWGWELLYTLRVLSRPTAGLERVARRMDRLVVGYWAGDGGLREIRAQGTRNLRRLIHTDNIELFVSDIGDHSLHGRTMRARLRAVVDRVGAEVLGDDAATDETASGDAPL